MLVLDFNEAYNHISYKIEVSDFRDVTIEYALLTGMFLEGEFTVEHNTFKNVPHVLKVTFTYDGVPFMCYDWDAGDDYERHLADWYTDEVVELTKDDLIDWAWYDSLCDDPFITYVIDEIPIAFLNERHPTCTVEDIIDYNRSHNFPYVTVSLEE